MARSEERRAARAASGRSVALCEPRPSDEAEFVELRRASRAFLAPWEATFEGEDPFGPERFRRFLRRNPRRRRFLIRRLEGDELVGALSLSEIDVEARTALVGYWIGERHARQGLMSEALELALGFARSELALERIEAFVLAENEPSRALLGKLGFVLESIEPHYRVVAGAMRDHERWVRALGPGSELAH